MLISVLVDIHKLGDCASLRDCLCGGDEGVGYSHNNIARLDPAGNDGKAQRVRATADGNRVSRITEAGECFFKFLNYRATYEICCAKP